MLTNDQLFWGFVVYDFVKSIIILGLGIKWGFSYGLNRADQMMEAVVKKKEAK